ncbi:MAG: 3-phosphoshikimate 1-carboxyvinyltransferase [Bacteroidales bacterium]
MNRLTIYKSLIANKVPLIKVPASKSISNRLLVLNAVFDNKLTIQNLSKSEDTLLLQSLLEQYSRNIHHFNCHNAGTVFRFLTAFLSFQPGIFYLTGSYAMKKRPIYPLVDAIKKIDSSIKITYPEKYGFPPLEIRGTHVNQEIETNIDSSISSQFITALLITGIQKGVTLNIGNKPASYSYIQMTLMLLEKLGIQYHRYKNTLRIPAQQLQQQAIWVEYDWSSAAPWYVLTSIMHKGYSLQIDGLHKESIQGDTALNNLFNHLGVQTNYTGDSIVLHKTSDPPARALELDTTDIPDTVLYLLTACAANKIELTLTGISHLRYKESDRIKAMQKELKKLGAELDVTIKDTIKLHPAESINTKNDIIINPHGDHRIAMAFAPLAGIIDDLSIHDPDSVKKSYPNFWLEFQKCGFHIQ